jgi:hypothetical protein
MNPRGDVDFTGLSPRRVSYKADGADIVFSQDQPNGSAVAGRAVTMSGPKTVRLAGDGDPVEGKLERVERDGVAVVNTDGFDTLPGGAAAALTPGRKIVGALGAGGARGYVREAAGADALNARGGIVDASDPANVIVRLS